MIISELYAGQGQQSEFRQNSKVRVQIRELPIAWILLEEIYHAWTRQFYYHLCRPITIRKTLSTRREGHAVVPNIQWVGHCQQVVSVANILVPGLWRARKKGESEISISISQQQSVAVRIFVCSRTIPRMSLWETSTITIAKITASRVRKLFY